MASFDVRVPPPERGRPPTEPLIDWDEMIRLTSAEFDKRNGPPFEWADAEA